jgi:DNA-binding response OmpR family regulator
VTGKLSGGQFLVLYNFCLGGLLRRRTGVAIRWYRCKPCGAGHCFTTYFMTDTNKIRILVVEDDLQVSSFIHRSLQEQGYEVQMAFDGETGLSAARHFDPQLVVADVVMPVKSGLQMCRDLRAAGLQIPVLLLTALGSTQDIVAGLDAGADDYLPKPFQLPELMARIRALLRRQETRLQARHLQIDDLVIDLQAKEVTRGGQRIQLQRISPAGIHGPA